MSLEIASICSGSNGNCYYVGNNNEAILVDVGMPAAMIETRIKSIGLDIKKVKAIFISHEHSDHIKGLSTLAHRHFIPIYITKKTARGINLINHLSKPFVADETVEIGALKITPFFKHHDAIDAHSFIIENNEICVGVFTDIGIVCENLIKYYSKCNAAFLEANYDEEMLMNGKYSEILKQRIAGKNGHLSNKQALELFMNHSNKNLSLLILSHISKENNSLDLVQKTFEENSSNTTITIATRYSPTEVFIVEQNKSHIKNKEQQLSLFQQTQA